MIALTKSNAASVNMARQHRNAGNPLAYAKLVSAAIRAASTINQVRALWLTVDADNMGAWLDDSNVLCPVARDVGAAKSPAK